MNTLIADAIIIVEPTSAFNYYIKMHNAVHGMPPSI